MPIKFIISLILIFLTSCAGPNPNPGERTVDRGWTKGNYEKPLSILKPKAEQGEPWAQLRMGIFVANGWGVTANKALAIDWYTKAAKQTAEGDWANGLLVGAAGRAGYFNQNSDALIAQYNLAKIYFFDENFKDLNKAYLLAANVLKEMKGNSIFFCCEFAGGRHFSKTKISSIKAGIEEEMSSIELKQAEKQSASWTINDL